MAEDKSYITYIVDKDDENATKHYFRDADLKKQVDELENNYDAKGSAAAVEATAKTYTDNKISAVIGADSNKTIREIAAEETAKIAAGADTRYDTIKEIADWIINDTTGAAKMANDISNLKTTAENIVDSNQIILDEGFQITETVGGIAPKVLDNPMSLKDLLKSILCKEVAGRITSQPSVSVSLSPSTTSYETGTIIQPTVNFSLSGSYSANNGFSGGTPTIEITDKVVNGISCGINSTLYKGGETRLMDKANITYKVEISYKVNNADKIYIKSNIGNSGQSLKDALSLDSTLTTKKEATTSAITSYRNVFYGKSTETNLNHWDIRSLENKEKFKRNSENNSIEMTAEIGDTYIVAAIPAGASNIKKEYWLESASAWKEWKEFDREVTNVGGADATENDIGFVDITYYVYYFRTMNHSPFTSKTKFRISYDHKEV